MEADPMTFDEESLPASADGILQCLRLLAEEAAMLKLRRTLVAIQSALEAALSESREEQGSRSAMLLH
jgi:hypothetical protein